MPADSSEAGTILDVYSEDRVRRPLANAISVGYRLIPIDATPYTGLETVSSLVKDQIVEALRRIAEDDADSRQPSACLEMGVCYASGFGIGSDGVVDDAKNARLATQWLKKAAEKGDTWARLAILPIFRALEQDMGDDLPLVQWLLDAAAQGSVAALSQLAEIDDALHENARKEYQAKYSGNSNDVFGDLHISTRQPGLAERISSRGDTVLHYAASVGRDDRLLVDLLKQNHDPNSLDLENFQGDTALVCAARAGNAHAIKALVEAGASAAIPNSFNETPLHFLYKVEGAEILGVGIALAMAGARLDTVATGSSETRRTP